jgi:low affinity Fe/Cu permease
MKFSKFAQALSKWTGNPKTFVVAVLLICVWAVTGPFFHYNDTWQLIINTSTTIITFLMVFLVQNTQNRDTDELPERGVEPGQSGPERTARAAQEIQGHGRS